MAELRQYRYFLEIARRGSFTAASRTLHITQSALSEQIMQLEREFDTRLFDRGRHGARLTPAGERLVARVEELLRVANEIERTVGQLGTQREALRLGMTMSPLLAWFPTIVAELERTVEGLVCTIEDIATAEIFLQVNTGDLDLGIISTSDPTVAESSSPGLV
ncbi:MAG: LysR family transcriptional regulator, partial [Actinobacteria bacterium]|nr:LysR family transcriptional regulator [Actinomycetota bacterium]